MDTTIAFTVNGQPATVTSDPQRPLLDVLREDLKLTGTKYGCGEGACRACTVLMDGKPVTSCNTPAAKAAGTKIVTIEGLSKGDELHPVQEAFLAERAFQCGYCTPGMVLATFALLSATPNPTDEQITSALNGHLCRCGGYERIIKVVRRASGKAGR
jgi:aerobic-type carbon monoxide dehydrogenase small subunit (CoxS/CutS family)